MAGPDIMLCSFASIHSRFAYWIVWLARRRTTSIAVIIVILTKILLPPELLLASSFQFLISGSSWACAVPYRTWLCSVLHKELYRQYCARVWLAHAKDIDSAGWLFCHLPSQDTYRTATRTYEETVSRLLYRQSCRATVAQTWSSLGHWLVD